MVFPLFLRQVFLDLLPVCLRGSKRMIAVTHGHQHRPALAIMFLGFVKQGRHGIQGLAHLILRNERSCYMSAAEHQVCVIDHLCPFCLFERFDHCAVRIIDQDEDMRKFHRSSSADPESRRNTLYDCFLGGADQRSSADIIVKRIQIDTDDQTQTAPSFSCPSDNDTAGRKCLQDPLIHIVGHCFADLHDPFLFIRFSKIILRKHQTKGGRCITDQFICFLPVFRIRGVLVAGNDRPLLIIRAVLGKHNLGNLKSQFFPAV